MPMLTIKFIFQKNDGGCIKSIPRGSMKTKFYLLLMSLLAMIISFPADGFSRQPNPKIWEPLGNGSYYSKTIITKAPDTLLAWTYKTIAYEARAKRIEEVKKYNAEKSMKYENYHHETVLWEMNCKNRLIMMKEIIDFDRQGKVLDRYRYNDGEWESITPGSGVDRLYQNVCTTKKKPSPKKKVIYRTKRR